MTTEEIYDLIGQDNPLLKISCFGENADEAIEIVKTTFGIDENATILPAAFLAYMGLFLSCLYSMVKKNSLMMSEFRAITIGQLMDLVIMGQARQKQVETP